VSDVTVSESSRLGMPIPKSPERRERPSACAYCGHSKLKHGYSPSKGGASACKVKGCPCWAYL